MADSAPAGSFVTGSVIAVSNVVSGGVAGSVVRESRPRRRWPFRAAGLAIAMAAALSCVSDVSGNSGQTLWEAVLVGVPPHSQASGSAATVSQGSLTEASVLVVDLGEGTFTWRIREGTCNDPGTALGSGDTYPDLVVPEGESTETAEALVPDPMLGGRRYLAEVRESATGDLVACGEFARNS